jgi:hypothetical protein
MMCFQAMAQGCWVVLVQQQQHKQGISLLSFVTAAKYDLTSVDAARNCLS